MRKILFLAILLAPTIVSANEITTFQQIPFITGEVSSSNYIQAIYMAAIALGAIAAVGMLIWAGAEYMLSDLVTKKSAAKERIKNALLGLLIILGAVTILNTINPNLTRLTIIEELETSELAPTTTQSGSENTGVVNNTPLRDEFYTHEFVHSTSILSHCQNSDSGCFDRTVSELTQLCNQNQGNVARDENYWTGTQLATIYKCNPN